MVKKLVVKAPVTKGAATATDEKKSAPRVPSKITSAASVAKANGGSAYAGTG